MATNEQGQTAPRPSTAAAELAAVGATFEPVGQSPGGGREQHSRKVEVNKQICLSRRVMNENTNSQEKHARICRILKRKWDMTLIVTKDKREAGNFESEVQDSGADGESSVLQLQGVSHLSWDDSWEDLTEEDLIKACDDVVNRQVQ